MRRNFKKAISAILAATMILSQNGIVTFASENAEKKAYTNESYQEVVETEDINDVLSTDTEGEGLDETDIDEFDIEEDDSEDVLAEIEKKLAPLTEDDDEVSAMKYAETPTGYVTGYDENGLFKFYCNETGAYVATYLKENPGSYKYPVIIPEKCKDEKGVEYDVVGIYANAFAGSTSIKYIRLADTIKTIGERAFFGSSINNVEAGSECKLEYIGTNAFRSSALGSGLTTTNFFVIPDTVTRIGSGAFRDCKSLSQITLPNTEFVLDVSDDVYNTDEPNNGRADLTDEERMSRTAETFAGCTELSRVNYQEGTKVKVLPANTFLGCEALQKITLVGETKTSTGVNFDVDETQVGVEYLGDRCFYGCKKIASFTASDTLLYIGVEAFCPDLAAAKRESALKTVNLDNAVNLKEIRTAAFKGTLLGTSATQTGKIVIPSTIEKIGYEAFRECTNLGTVTFESPSGTVSDNTLKLEAPASYSNTFADCTNLKKVILPTHLEGVEAYTFRNCKALATCDYEGFDTAKDDGGSIVSYIGEKAFYECISLKELKAPASLIYIGESAYEGCKALTWVDLEYSEELETIAKRAFANSSIGSGRGSRYSTVYISKRMKDIGQEAFLNCSELTNIELNNNITKTDISEYESLTIGQSAFEGCTELQEVTVGRLADNLYKKNRAIVPTNPISKINEYAIGNRAFYKDENLKAFYSVVYDYGVENQVEAYFKGDLEDQYAVDEAENNQEFIESDDVITTKSVLFTVGESAFEGCKSLLYAPFVATPALKEIKSLAFNDCISLELFEESKAKDAYKYGDITGVYNDGPYIIDEDGNIETYAGAANSAVRRIGSNNLASIGYKAFNNTAIGKKELEDIDKDKEVRRLKLYGSPEIGYNAFSNTSSLAYLDILGAPTFKEQTTDKDVKGSTFEKGVVLKEVLFRDGIEEICSYMFANCTELEKVIWPSTLKRIGKAAFFKDAKLQSFNKEENLVNLEQIEGYAFANCTSLEEVYFTNSNKLTSIGTYAFYYAPCGSKKNMGNRKIIIPCTVSAIGEYAFAFAAGIEEVYFDNKADGVTTAETITLGKGCFTNCSRLMTMYLPIRCKDVPEAYMLNCPKLIAFYVPKTVTKFGKDAVSASAIKKTCTVYGDVAVCGASEFAKKNGLKYSYDLSVLPIFAQDIALSVYMYEEEFGELKDTTHLGTYFVQLKDGRGPNGEEEPEYEDNVYVGSKIHIKSTILPQTVEDKDVIYYSTNDRVALVNNDGIATIVGYGTTRLYAISKSKSAVASCTTLTVNGKLSDAKRKQYTADVKAICGDLIQLVRNVYPTTDYYSLDDVDLSSSELGNDVEAKWTESYPIIGDGVKRKTVAYDGVIKPYTVTIKSEKYGDIPTEALEIKAHTITGAYLWPTNYNGVETEKLVQNNTFKVGNSVYYDVYVTTLEKKYDPKARYGGGIRLTELLNEGTQFKWGITNDHPSQIAATKLSERPGVVEIKASKPVTGAKIGVNVLFIHQKKTLSYDKNTLGTNWVTGSMAFNAIDGLVVDKIDVQTNPSPIGPEPLIFNYEDNGEMQCAEIFKYVGDDGKAADAIYKVDGFAYAHEYNTSSKVIEQRNVPASLTWTVSDTKMATVKTVAGQLYLTVKKNAVGEFLLNVRAAKNGGYTRSIKIRVLDDTVLAPRLSTPDVSIDQNYDQNARPTTGDKETDIYWDADDKAGYQYADVEVSIPDYFKNQGLELGDGLEISNLRLATSQGRGSNRYELKDDADLKQPVLKEKVITEDGYGNEKKTYELRIITKPGKVPTGTETLYVYGTCVWKDETDVTHTYDFKTSAIVVKGIKTTPTITFTQEPCDYVKLYSTELGGDVLIRSSEEMVSVEYVTSAATGRPALFGEKVTATTGEPMYETKYHLQMGNDTDLNYKSTVLSGTFIFKFKKYAEYPVFKKSFASKAVKDPNPIVVTADTKVLAPFTEADTAHIIITDAVTGDRITDNGLYYKKTARDGKVYYIKDENSDDYTINIKVTNKKGTTEDPNFEINPPIISDDIYKVDDYTVKAIGMTDNKNFGVVGVTVNGSWRKGITKYAYVQLSTVENEGPLGLEKSVATLNVNSDERYNSNDEFNPSNEINSTETKIFVPGFEDDEYAKRINPADFNITGSDLASKQQLDYGKIIADVVWPEGYVEYCKTMDYKTYGVEGKDPKFDEHVYKNPVLRLTVKPGKYNVCKQFVFKISAKIDEPDDVDNGKKINLSSNFTVGIYPRKLDIKQITHEGIKFKDVTETDIPSNRINMVLSSAGFLNVVERDDTYLAVKTSIRCTSQEVVNARLVGGYANLFESKYDPDKKELYIKASSGDDIKALVSYPMKIEVDLKNGTKATAVSTNVSAKQIATTVVSDKKSIRLYAGATGIEAGTDVIFIPKNGRIKVSPFYPEKALYEDYDDLEIEDEYYNEYVDDEGNIISETIPVPKDDLGRTFLYLDANGMLHGDVAKDEDNDGYVDAGTVIVDDDYEGEYPGENEIPIYNPRKTTYKDMNYAVKNVSAALPVPASNFIFIPYDGEEYYAADYRVVNSANSSDTFTFKAGTKVKDSDKDVSGYDVDVAKDYIVKLPVYDPTDIESDDYVQGRNGAKKYRLFLKPTSTAVVGNNTLKLNFTFVDGDEKTVICSSTLPVTVIK